MRRLVLCIAGLAALAASPALAAGVTTTTVYTTYRPSASGCTSLDPNPSIYCSSSGLPMVLGGFAQHTESASAAGAFSVKDIANGGDPWGDTYAASNTAEQLRYLVAASSSSIEVVVSYTISQSKLASSPSSTVPGLGGGDYASLVATSTVVNEGGGCDDGTNPVGTGTQRLIGSSSSEGAGATSVPAGNYIYHAYVYCPDGSTVSAAFWDVKFVVNGSVSTDGGDATAQLAGQLNSVTVNVNS
ncbi:MAG: hypothetical protein ACYDAY_10195 [Candidatus Dormibacteria bacterium]